MITLRTLTDGLPHPKAQRHIIGYSLGATFTSYEWYTETHINGSRLGVVFRPTDPDDSGFSVVVWDWTTGEMVLVSGSYCNTPVPIDAPYSLPSSASRTNVANLFSSWTNIEFSFGKMTTTSSTSTILQTFQRPGGCRAIERSVWVCPTRFTLT